MRYTTTDGPKKPLNAIQEGSLGGKMGIAGIVHGMGRFSEDLDFILKQPDPDFSWPVYLQGMVQCFDAYSTTSGQ